MSNLSSGRSHQLRAKCGTSYLSQSFIHRTPLDLTFTGPTAYITDKSFSDFDAAEQLTDAITPAALTFRVWTFVAGNIGTIVGDAVSILDFPLILMFQHILQIHRAMHFVEGHKISRLVIMQFAKALHSRNTTARIRLAVIY